MLFTMAFKLCVFLGLCKLDEYEKISTEKVDLNSFSSKTAYRNVKLEPFVLKDDFIKKCHLIQSNVIFRHGTRFPSFKDIEKISTIHKKIMKSQANIILPEAFRKWKPVFSSKKEKELASVGYEEMMILGNRMRKKLNYVVGDFDPIKHVKIYSSSVVRSKLSASTFYSSFLNKEKSIKETSKFIIDKDSYLRFFDFCPYYDKHVLKNKLAKVEFNKFLVGSEMKRILRDIQQKWKLTDVVLTTDDVRVLYVNCGYEIATNLSSFMKPNDCPVSPAGDGLVVCPDQEKLDPIETSPLCTLFLNKHYEIVEYLYDLKHYWLKAYGHEINWLQSCDLMSPLIEIIMDAARQHEVARKTFSASVNKRKSIGQILTNQNYMRASYWFGHAETIIPIFALLNLFNQTSPMTSSNFQTHLNLMKDPSQRFKLFRVSNMAPFAGNIALDLYHCSEPSTEYASGYRIQVLVNERPVQWPIANGLSHVSLERFLHHLNLCLADKYDHDAVCVRGYSSQQLHETRRRSDEL